MNDGSGSYVQAQDRKCRRWVGLRGAYQSEARQTLAVSTHYWISTTCTTKLCLLREHLVAHSPEPLDYPPGICVYCGLRADTVDHLLPRTWTGESERRNVLTVPACQQCNSILSDRYVPSITDRRETVHAALYSKYRKQLHEAEDIDDWMSELGPNLRSAIEAQRSMAAILRDRLAWPGTDNYDIGACVRAGIADPYAMGLLTDSLPVDYVTKTKQSRPWARSAPIVFRDRTVPCSRGCDCSLCRKLSRGDRRREQRVMVDGRWVFPNPPPGHGTAAAYGGYSCRCEPCAEAMRQKNEARLERRLNGVWIPDPRRPWQGVLNLWGNGAPWPRDYTPRGRG